MSEIRKMAGAVVALGAATAAVAAPVTVSQTLSLNQLLSGGSTTLEFDLSAALAAQGLSAGGVMSGELVVYGVSDAVYSDYFQYGNYQVTRTYTEVAFYQFVAGTYVCSLWSFWTDGKCLESTYVPPYYIPVYANVVEQERKVDITHGDAVADQMSVSAGNLTESGLVGYSGPLATGYGIPISEGISGTRLDIIKNYKREQNIYEGYYGSLDATLGLDTAALADLNADGILDASVTAAVGQFRITGATLKLLVDAVPPGDVAEPGSLALVALAAGAGLAAKRRRRPDEA
jgi:hypothetical protein